MNELQQEMISQLRDMARQGESVGAMFRALKKRLGTQGTIPTIIEYLRSAFHLSLAQVKPVAALSRNEQGEIADDSLLDQLVRPHIDKHRNEWEKEYQKQTTRTF